MSLSELGTSMPDSLSHGRIVIDYIWLPSPVQSRCADFSSRNTDDVVCPSPALERLMPDLLKAAVLASVVVPMPTEGARKESSSRPIPAMTFLSKMNGGDRVIVASPDPVRGRARMQVRHARSRHEIKPHSSSSVRPRTECGLHSRHEHGWLRTHDRCGRLPPSGRHCGGCRSWPYLLDQHGHPEPG